MEITPLSKTKDICLVQMPIALTTVPAFSLSLFKALFNERNISSIVIYNNLKFLEKIGAEYYSFIEHSPVHHLTGEFLFSKAAGWKTAKDAGEYSEWLRDTYNYKYLKSLPKVEVFWEKLPETQEKATAFIAEAVDEVLSFQPKIVGCASMFQQNLASLAFLRQVKEREPGIITLIGGANCMGEAAIAMAESMPWLDYVFSGEADEIIADFCVRLLADGVNIPEESLPYGVIKKGMRLNEKKPYRLSANLNNLPTPDYSDYFETLGRFSFTETEIIPGLFIEGSRGCWWGEKKPCSFCGLGGVSHKYRQKSTAKVLSEIKELSAKHTIKRFVFADSILSMKHIAELMPELEKLNASEKDKYAFFSETKSNFTETQVKNLKEAGFSWIQPGIESIQDDFLKVMNKGNRAIKHLEFLKHCRTYCLNPIWNMLIGFPHEKKEWIEQIIAIIPLITHLPPPNQTRRIAYQKHSVYVNNPQDYELCLRPVETYSYLYPDEGIFEGLTEKIAYLFEPADKKERDEYYEIVPLEQYAHLDNQVAAWHKKFYKIGDTMTMRVYDDKIEIIDLRTVSQKNLITLTGVEKEIYTAAENAVNKRNLFLKLKSRFDLRQIEQAIEKLCKDKLMLEINGELLALASKNAAYYYPPAEDFPLGHRKQKKYRKYTREYDG